MKENKTIGMTIGPIYKTLAAARKTRELWGASYIFSYLMKTIIKTLIEKGIKKEHIIVPYTGSIDRNEYHYGAGLFPDRLILRAGEKDFEKVKQTIEEVLSGLGEKIAGFLNENLEEVQKYIANYFQVYFLEKELEGDKGPILELSPYLDTMELMEKFMPSDDQQYLAVFFDRVNSSFLFKDGFPASNDQRKRKKRFESIIEISARELRKFDEAGFDKIIKDHFNTRESGDEEEDILIEKLKNINKIKDNFKTCHKYIAIVQADGDNISKTLIDIGNDEEKLNDFSERLNTFAGEAAGIIHEYGGTPVYIGGDDLLFFAPVVNTNTSIFDLINTLDEKFKTFFHQASLSFGVSISYYKFPLNEALETARHLLLKEAKEYKNNEGIKVKNALAFKFLKHSGISFGATFNKDSHIYSRFQKLLASYGGEERHLNSIVHSLQLNRNIFKTIGKNEEKVKHFLKNSFDEEIHKEFEDFIETAAELIFNIYNERPAEGEDKKFSAIYAILRTLLFLKRKDNE